MGIVASGLVALVGGVLVGRFSSVVCWRFWLLPGFNSMVVVMFGWWLGFCGLP